MAAHVPTTCSSPRGCKRAENLISPEDRAPISANQRGSWGKEKSGRPQVGTSRRTESGERPRVGVTQVHNPFTGPFNALRHPGPGTGRPDTARRKHDRKTRSSVSFSRGRAEAFHRGTVRRLVYSRRLRRYSCLSDPAASLTVMIPVPPIFQRYTHAQTRMYTREIYPSSLSRARARSPVYAASVKVNYLFTPRHRNIIERGLPVRTREKKNVI